MGVQAGVLQQVEHRSNGPGAWLCATKVDAGETGVQTGAGTHGTRLHRAIQSAILEPEIADATARSAQGKDFRMRRRITIGARPVVRHRQHFPVAHHHRAHRYFSGLRRQICLRQSQRHKVRV